MKFDPSDGQDMGPHCRNCHRGSSACGACHAGGKSNDMVAAAKLNTTGAADLKLTTYDPLWTSTGETNTVSSSTTETVNSILGFYKKSKTTNWSNTWREATGAVDMGNLMTTGNEGVVGAGTACSDNGFSWPHRTLGWKMLKDDLFGLDFDGITEVQVGGTRAGISGTAHDIDSVCLDCHNPNVWNATSSSHEDSQAIDSDNYNDELLLRGLP